MAAATLAETKLGSLLDRHEQRRRGKIPTVSVLAGTPAALMDCLRGWAGRRGRPLVLLERGPWSMADLAVAWVRAAAGACDLREQAASWLARQLSQGSTAPPPALLARTPHELELFLDQTLPGALSSAEGAMLRTILLEPALLIGEDVPGDSLAGRLDRRFAAFPLPWTRVPAALAALIAEETQPVLALVVEGTAREPGRASALEVTARLLAELAFAQPVLSLAMVAEAGAVVDYLDSAPESRVKAILRESVIHVADVVPERSRPPIPSTPARPEAMDDARSAAERFLFDCLQSMPETAGLFRLNATLATTWESGHEFEIDLFAESLGLAVEIDGYHHFHDADGYRRDRRKDLELQKRGFLVVRVLADDVVGRLEDVLETVRSAVASRRGPAGDSTGGIHE